MAIIKIVIVVLRRRAFYGHVVEVGYWSNGAFGPFLDFDHAVVLIVEDFVSRRREENPLGVIQYHIGY